MAAFSSNIDITSGGTYAMDVTNGETSSKVATDLNGKFANIQELLQNGLPEVWTGDSLPDSLPNGKIIIWNNKVYYGNALHSVNNFVIGTKVINSSSTSIAIDGCSGWCICMVSFTVEVDYYTVKTVYGYCTLLAQNNSSMSCTVPCTEIYSGNASNTTTYIDCNSYINDNKRLGISCTSDERDYAISIEKIKYLYMIL